MKNTQSLTQGTAIALLFLLALPGHAQTPTAIPVAATAESEVLPLDHGIADAVDPVVRNEVMELRRTGLIEFQGQVGTDLLTIERLQRRAQAIQSLIGSVGTEGLKQFDPALYEALETSPVMMNQRIAELRLQRELEEERRLLEEGAEADDGEVVVAARVGRVGPADIFNSAPFTPQPVIEDVEEVVEEVPAYEPPPPPPIVDFPISLREILGFNGEYRAVILHGSELVRVEAGDQLPNDTEILEIRDDRIQVRRRDMTFDIHLRG